MKKATETTFTTIQGMQTFGNEQRQMCLAQEKERTRLLSWSAHEDTARSFFFAVAFLRPIFPVLFSLFSFFSHPSRF
jgi:hypothetical protein